VAPLAQFDKLVDVLQLASFTFGSRGVWVYGFWADFKRSSKCAQCLYSELKLHMGAFSMWAEGLPSMIGTRRLQGHKYVILYTT